MNKDNKILLKCAEELNELATRLLQQVNKEKDYTQQIKEELEDVAETFKEEHNGTTKASQQRARKAIGEIKKLVTDYRKASVDESK